MHLLHPKYKVSVYDEGISFKEFGYHANPSISVRVPVRNTILEERINTKILQKPKLRPKTIDELSFFVQAAEEVARKNKKPEEKPQESQKKIEHAPSAVKDRKTTKNVQWGGVTHGTTTLNSDFRRGGPGNSHFSGSNSRFEAQQQMGSTFKETAYAELHGMEPCCVERSLQKDYRMANRNDKLERAELQRERALAEKEGRESRGFADVPQRAKTQNVWKKVRFVVSQFCLGMH
jgi:hypothetical protein